MATQDTTDARIAAEAEHWCVRLRERDCGPAERRRFERWLDAKAAHRQALERAERMWDTLGALMEEPAMRALPEARVPPRPLFPRSSRAWAFPLAATAAAALVVAVVVGYRLWPGEVHAPIQVHQTSAGETRTLRLQDNSTVTLDVGSRIAVQYDAGERRVWLQAGTAFFDVVPERERAFVVEAGRGKVTVMGTRFQVSQAAGKVEVALLDGAVRLGESGRNGAPPGRVLKPGQRAVMAEGGAGWQTASVDVEALTAWRQGRLVFHDTPLAEALAQVNRYQELPLRVDDPSLAMLPVNGVFRIGDGQTFALALEHTLPVRVVADENGKRVVDRKR